MLFLKLPIYISESLCEDSQENYKYNNHTILRQGVFQCFTAFNPALRLFWMLFDE